jgi:Protein of unknown function (DUF2786)
MTKMKKIIATITALRARALDAASSETEALAAITRADEMMREHSLTVDDLQTAADNGGIIQTQWGSGTLKMHPVSYVGTAVSNMTDTRCWIRRTDTESHLVFMGFEADVTYALYLVDLIHNTMNLEWDKFRETNAYLMVPPKRRGRLRDDFMRAMAARLRERIMNIVATRRVKVPELGYQTGTALVVAKREMISAALEQMELKFKKSRASKKKYNAAALRAGFAAGDRTNITTGIGCDA